MEYLKLENGERRQENLDIFDFSLDSNDMALIAKLDERRSLFGWY